MRTMTEPPAIADRFFRSLRSASRPGLRTGSAASAGGSVWVAVTAMSGEPDPRVDHRVEEVDQQVDEDEGRGHDQHAAADERVVARVDRLDGEAAEPRPGEDRFGEDRPAEEEAELQPDDRQDRDERVAERVDDDDPPVGEPLGAR